MKNLIRLSVVLGLAFGLAGVTVRAAGGETKGKGAENAVPQDVGRLTHQDDTAGKADRSEMSDDLKTAIAAFQEARTDFLKQQASLKDKLVQADTKGERAQVRAELKALFKSWMDQQKELRNQLRDELRDMRDNLHNARDKQLDEVKGKGNGKGGKGRD